MSGGSFSYVSVTDPMDGDGAWPNDEHNNIIDALSEYPGSEDAVRRARACLDAWRKAMREVSEEWCKLSPVLKAVEWHRSGDWGVDSVARELAALK